ncbi:MAG TPA: phage/plasmid primase, P4 family [Drouetiella sp.]
MTSAFNEHNQQISPSVVETIAAAWNDGKVKRGSEGWIYSRCPIHGDKTESLSMKWIPGKTGLGKVLFKCHVGCGWKDLEQRAVDERYLPVWKPQAKQTKGATIEFWEEKGLVAVECYPYVNADRSLEFEKWRFYDPATDTKSFRQRQSNGKGGFDKWKLTEGPKPLYKLPELLDAIKAGKTIFIVEGEKDVNNMFADGLVATCNFEGGGKWKPEYNEFLRNAERVVLVLDNDHVGYEHLNLVASELAKVDVCVEWLVMPGATKHDDFSDWRENHSASEFEPLLSETQLWFEPVANPWPSPAQERAKAKNIANEGIAFGDEKKVPNNVVALREETPPINMEYVEMWTDAGNGKRFKQAVGDDALWCPESGWRLWTGTRYERDNLGRIREIAKDVARSIMIERTASATKLATFAAKTLNEKGLSNMLKSAQSLVPASIEHFDLDTDIINTPDGIVDLTTGKLSSWDRKHRCSLITACGYDESAFAEFISITDDTPIEVADEIYLRLIPHYRNMMGYMCSSKSGIDWQKFNYLQEIGGYCFSGRTHIQQAWFFEGEGRNLKSTWIDNLADMLGGETNGYSVTVRTSMFMRPKGGATENHLDNFSQLQDKRMVAVQELNSDDCLDEAKFKIVTGHTDRLKGRYMRGEPFEVRKRCKFIFRTNHLPRVRNQDDGVWRRMRRVPCHTQVPDDQVDTNASEKLRSEWSQQAAFFVAGLIRLMRREDLPQPDCVAEMTREYKAEMDTIGEMLDECFIKAPTNKLTITDFLKVHTMWSHRNNMAPLSRIELAKRLKKKGIVGERLYDEEGHRVSTITGWAIGPGYGGDSETKGRYTFKFG